MRAEVHGQPCHSGPIEVVVLHAAAPHPPPGTSLPVSRGVRLRHGERQACRPENIAQVCSGTSSPQHPATQKCSKGRRHVAKYAASAMREECRQTRRERVQRRR